MATLFFCSWPGHAWRLALLLLALLGCLSSLAAHPMPSTRVLLDIQPKGVAAELQLPLGELLLALGQPPALLGQQTVLVAPPAAVVRNYLLAHVQPLAPNGRPWTVAVGSIRGGQVEQTATGPYQELTAELWLQPPPGASSRTFTLRYDVILHQVVTHSALVAIRQDWDGGVLAEQPVELGIIQLDPRDNSIAPLRVAPAAGSRWRGFQSMVLLGMRHIGEGTDHLLFLLALLLPAPLVLRFGRWGGFGGGRYAGGRVLRIVTAFTVGHSLMLALGALGWVQVPAQLVEALIAVSILVSAVHAWRPVFAGREAWVAAGFGLVHGLAFASTLSGLHLDAGRLVLSVLGFNLGIEVMQIFLVGLTMPWLLLLARTPAYGAVRRSGAVLAGGAALAWLAERLTGQPNALTVLVSEAAAYGPWLLGALAGAALLNFWRSRTRLA